MHSRRLILLFCISSIATFALAQSGPVNDGTEGLSLQTLAENTYQASWWARTGRTYFLLHSNDLVSWEYFPLIETGANALVSYGFTNENPNIFVRLRYEDEVYADPYALDSDGDGITNQQELIFKTDPFNADSDGDGLIDKWEIDLGLDPRDSATRIDSDDDKLPDLWENYYFLNLSRDGSGHFDADGINDKQESLLGSRPDDDAVISTSIGLLIRNFD
jgi:Bacterial TSP3 repeat